MVKLRWVFLLGLSLLLGACGSIEATPATLDGQWRDNEAQFTTCGQTRAVVIELELSQTGNALTGTFTLQNANFPFEGSRSANTVSGEVKDSNNDATLTADLAVEGDALKGTFSATQSIECPDGSTSVTVYGVNLKKL